MAINRGKEFETVIRRSFEKVLDTSVDRIPDQTAGYLGAKNISDFIVYKYPHEYYIECKSVHGNTLPFSNVSSAQWDGLLNKSKIDGVFAGIICWWIDKDVTKFLPIDELDRIRRMGEKSVRYDSAKVIDVEIVGRKKRIFFEYDMERFFKEMEDFYE